MQNRRESGAKSEQKGAIRPEENKNESSENSAKAKPKEIYVRGLSGNSRKPEEYVSQTLMESLSWILNGVIMFFQRKNHDYYGEERKDHDSSIEERENHDFARFTLIPRGTQFCLLSVPLSPSKKGWNFNCKSKLNLSWRDRLNGKKSFPWYNFMLRLLQVKLSPTMAIPRRDLHKMDRLLCYYYTFARIVPLLCWAMGAFGLYFRGMHYFTCPKQKTPFQIFSLLCFAFLGADNESFLFNFYSLFLQIL